MLCRKNGADDQCFRAQSILHPPCAQNPENWSGEEEDLPSCHSLAHTCRDDNNCRKSLERYEQTCSVDSDSKTCAATYPACRDAMVEILGTDMVYNYEQILRQITYNNMKPAYYLNRQFKLICSLRDVRATSNEYVQTVSF